MIKTNLIKCFLLFLIGFYACNNLSNRKTAHILPLDSVAELVVDTYFLEGEIYVKQRKCDIKDYTIVKYDSFFYAHGITKEIFVENVKYYFTNEKYAEKIMNLVDTLVEQRSTALRDSLNVK